MKRRQRKKRSARYERASRKVDRLVMRFDKQGRNEHDHALASQLARAFKQLDKAIIADGG